MFEVPQGSRRYPLRMDSPSYYVEISGLDAAETPDKPTHQSSGERRPWVGVRFDCCGVYARVYRNAEGTAYIGRCPRCTKRVRMTIGPGGTASRFFVAE